MAKGKTKGKAKNKKAFDFARNSSYVADPDDLVIMGVDVKCEESHALYDPSVKVALDPLRIKHYDREGVISTITIVKYDGMPVVVDGRDRVRYARAVNKIRRKEGREILRVTCTMSGGPDYRLRQKKIITNIVRKPGDPLTSSYYVQELLDQGHTFDEISVMLATPIPTLKSWLALQGASATVKHAVQSGKLPASAAAKIAKVPGAEAQNELLAETLESGEKNLAKAATRAIAAHTGTAAAISLGKKDQRKLLDYAKGGEQDLQSDYWSGFADAVRVILGEKAEDERGRKAAKEGIKAKE